MRPRAHAAWHRFLSGARSYSAHVTFALRHERGASLPEILIALTLSASAVGLVGTAVSQFFLASTNGNDRLTALHDIQNASLWLGRDASEAQSFTGGTGAVYGTLTTGDPNTQYRYSYDAGDSALVREHLINGAVQSSRKIARHIADQGDVSFSLSGSLLTVSITSTSADGEVMESTTLKVAMRVR